MPDSDDYRRGRIERERRDLERARRSLGGLPSMLGYVTTPQASLATGKFFSAERVVIMGEEIEGGDAQFNLDSSTVLSVVPVVTPPMSGDYVIAHHNRYRWGTVINGDPRCSGTATTITVNISACDNLALPGPGAWYVTIKRDGVLVDDGMSSVVGPATRYVYTVTREGTYEITASRDRFVTKTSTEVVTCGTSVGLIGVAQVEAGYCLIQACPDYPVPLTLTANDGFGDFSMTANHACLADFTAGPIIRSANTAICHSGSPVNPTLSTMDVPIWFKWYGNKPPPVGGTYGAYADCAQCFMGSPLAVHVDPAGTGMPSTYLQASRTSHTFTCNPFTATTIGTPSAALSQVYPGGFTFELFE